MTEAIRFDKVSLWRRTQEEFSYDLKKTVLAFFEGKYRQPAKKLVLDSLDLTINKGEKVGLIGSNGAGKSTLLKVICGILQPTTGTVRVRGKIAPLIELGAGFDDELSVLDNIVMYGVMLGFSRKEMMTRAKLILEFAELQEYGLIPVKGLSSGMKARLGFAIATDIEPDILILDELLSVGDERFKKKCEAKMDQFWQAGTMILLVSHSMDLVADSCDKAIWLDHGTVKFVGAAKDCIDMYLQHT